MDGEASTHENLQALNRRVQTILLLVAVPADAVIYVAHYVTQPCWQFLVPVVTTLGMSVAWGVSFLAARRGRMRWSVAVATLALDVHCVAVLLVRGSSLAIVALTMTTAMIYASFFSRRLLMICGSALVGAILLFEGLDGAGVLALAPPAPWLHRLFEGGFLLVIVPVLVFLVLERERIGRLPFLALEASSQGQRRVLETVARVLPELDALVLRLQRLSAALGAQASQQATTAAEVSASMDALRSTSGETAQAAAETRALSEAAREGSERSQVQISAVEAQFRTVLEVLRGALTRNQHLADESQRTGEIIDAIRDVDDQVGVLALNASIEAARAGDAGRGFAVVATELGRLMDSSTQRSRGSAVVLEGIQREATALAQEADQTSRTLGLHLQQLRQAADQVQEISSSHRRASEQVDRIAAAVEQQRAQTSAVSTAMRDASQSAVELSQLAREIDEALGALVRGSEQLRGVTQELQRQG